VIPDHYESLRVAPGADAAVIRAAYRALMRAYHPDRNHDPKAQSLVREITAAFAVLGNPAKRAAYDAARSFSDELAILGQDRFGPLQRPRPPMRNFGLASIGLAFALTVALAVRPDSAPAPRPHQVRHSPAPPPATHHAAPALQPASKVVTAEVVAPPGAVVAQEVAPLPPPPKAVAPKVVVHEANQPIKHALPTPRREGTQAQLPKPISPAPVAAAVKSASASSVPASGDDRRAQVERLAIGFFNQSMQHADWSKQQLLLSARTRSATLRTLCHSNECVADAYLRQIRDTTTIMEGRIPSQ
jgi:DnaJ domain